MPDFHAHLAPVVHLPVTWRTHTGSTQPLAVDVWRDAPMTDADIEERFQVGLLELQRIAKSDQVPKEKERTLRGALNIKYANARHPQERHQGTLISWDASFDASHPIGLVQGEDRRLHVVALDCLQVAEPPPPARREECEGCRAYAITGVHHEWCKADPK